MNFEKWILNFLSEQKIDITTVVDKERNIHIGHVINYIAESKPEVRAKTRNMLLMAVSNGGSIVGYFEHLAHGMTTDKGAVA